MTSHGKVVDDIRELTSLTTESVQQQLNGILEEMDTREYNNKRDMMIARLLADELNAIKRDEQAAEDSPKPTTVEEIMLALSREKENNGKVDTKAAALLSKKLRQSREPKLKIDRSATKIEQPKILKELRQISPDYAAKREHFDQSNQTARTKSKELTKRLENLHNYDFEVFRKSKFDIIDDGLDNEEDNINPEYEDQKLQEEDIDDVEINKISNAQASIKAKMNLFKTKQKQELERLVNREFNFKKLHDKNYKGMLKEIDQLKQKSNHKFLDSLNSVPDLYPVFNYVPSVLKLLESSSSVRGKFLVTQDIFSEPFPYLEFGDLATRLLYNDKDLMARFELDNLELRAPLDREITAPLTQHEFVHLLMGYDIAHEPLLKEVVSKAQLERFSASIGDLSFMDSVSDVVGSSRRPLPPIPSNISSTESLRRAVREEKAAEDRFRRANDYDANRPLRFPKNKMIKFLDKNILEVEKKNSQTQTDINFEKVQNEKIATVGDFENLFKEANELKENLPANLDPKNIHVKQYMEMLETLSNLLITVNEEIGDPSLLQSMPMKLSFILANLKGFKSSYIGNIYAPNAVEYVLREYHWLKYGWKVERKDKGNEGDKDSEDDKSDKIEEKGGVKYFDKTVDSLRTLLEKSQEKETAKENKKKKEKEQSIKKKAETETQDEMRISKRR